MTAMPDASPSALKEMFNVARYRKIAGLLADIDPTIDRSRFLAVATTGLDDLTLIQRVRRTTEACRATLPSEFIQAVAVLKQFARRADQGFTSIFLPDFVGQYGHDNFAESMDALKYFTSFGSSEFAVREFLRRDLRRTLAVMTTWSRDPDEHVRRLASEGCRPRLPWSFRLTDLVADPSPVRPILENLRTDSSLYVRKSVANHLNDISKDHPGVMLDWIEGWNLRHPSTAWIARHAARSLIKSGHARSLRLFGFNPAVAVSCSKISVSPAVVALGGSLTFKFFLKSTSPTRAQKLAVDYILHYQKKSGRLSPKVFKLKEVTLKPQESVALVKRQRLVDFSTRRHHPGRHQIEIMVNGTVLARRSFTLTR